MDFYEFSADDRSVWRADPITQAYLGLLGKTRDAHAVTAIHNLNGHDATEAYISAGRHNGFTLAVQMAEDER